jgi:acylphosphatase
MSAEAGVLAFVAKWLWVAVVGLCGWIWNKQDGDIKALKASAKDSVSEAKAKEMIKEAVQPVREELSRFQQQMTETNLLVRQISDNLTKLHTEFTVNVRVQEALTKHQKEGNV